MIIPPIGLLVYLCIAICDAQENEATRFQRVSDFVRQLTHQSHLTTPFLQALGVPPAQQTPDLQSRISSLYFPRHQNSPGFQNGRSYAAASASAIKRPDSADAKAVAYASVDDVKGEEEMADQVGEEYQGKSSSQDDYYGSDSSPSDFVTAKTSFTKSGPSAALKHLQEDYVVKKEEDDDSFKDVYFVAIVAGCCAVGIFGVVSAGFCFYRLQKSRKAAADVDYPAYGVTGPCKDITSPNGDRKLAQSAQMYHYQHQKQQMIAVEKAGSTKNTSASDVDSEEENEEGDYTVYECPGLAPTGEMEVKNPLFHDDSTPVSPPVLPAKPEDHK